MSDIIATLLLRNLQEVFGEGDPARRRTAIKDLYTEDCVVLLSTGRHVGRQALDQIAGELRAGHPTFVYTPHTAPQAVQDGGRIAWGSGPAGELPRYTGLDVIIARAENSSRDDALLCLNYENRGGARWIRTRDTVCRTA